MTKRLVPLLIIAIAVANGFRTNANVQPAAPAICTIDTSSSNYTLERIEDRLDPADTTAFGAGYRKANGLTGLAFAGISIVTDSAKCAAGIRAYAQITYPADSVARKNFLVAVDNIFIARLSADRLVFNANFYSPQSFVRLFLVDSAFSMVSPSF